MLIPKCLLKRLPNKKKTLFARALIFITYCFYYGAEGETRTPTGKPRLDPEPSASTSSATSASKILKMKNC